MTDTENKIDYRKWAKRIIIGLLIVSAIALIGIVAFVKMTLSETSISVLEEKTHKQYDPFATIYNDVSLEDGSIIDIKELESFYLFSGEKSPFNEASTRLKDAYAIAKIPEKANLYQVNQTVHLKSLLSNDCKEIYCYQHYLPFDYIPSIFWKGLIGVEDQRYLDHFGIDLKSLFRATLANLKSMKYAQGGSTISQQLVKNLFFTSEKTFTRKLKEMVVSIYIETQFPKEKILEAYLNEVHWGALQGIKLKGVHAASIFYFGKKPNEITPYEGAILIGLLKGPGFYHPIRQTNRLKERAGVVYKKLVQENFVPDDASVIWSDSQWESWKKYLIVQDEARYNQAIWRALEDKDPMVALYEKFVLMQKVHNVKMKIAKRFKEKYNTEDVSVKVYIGAVGKQRAYSYYSRIERNKEKAMNEERHQVGSTIKPVIYSVFEDLGKNINDSVSTAEVSLKLKSGTWSPREAHQVTTPEITLVDALLKSYNRPVIRVAEELGFDKVEAGLESYIPRLKSPLSEFPAQLLGSVELSVSELKEVFSKLIKNECAKIADGQRQESDSVLTILSDPTKTTVERAVDDIMQRVMFFGKTGTTNSSYDNWFVAFDGKNITVVWVGYEGERSIKSLGLYGSTTAFDVFQSFYRDRGKRFQHFSCDLIN